jgi:hypothetical protein
MLDLIKKKIDNEFIFKGILLLFLLIQSNFFLNIYTLIKHPFKDRMIANYGYCDHQGYGFIEKFKTKYNLSNNSKIINKHDFPSSHWFINQFSEIKDYEYIIHINSKELISDENILEQNFNCYIIKND